MVAQRRVGPLLVALALALLLVLARGFQVQVLQHGIWAGEAADMLRSSEVLPYHRGRLLDRHGAVLAQDEDRRRLELVYREFRRGNPIAEMAHARSTLEMRAVSLGEAEANLERYAAELLALRPGDLLAFARGGALEACGVPALDPEQARGALRERRAADLRYYAAELLELSPSARGRLAKAAAGPDAGRTLLELGARERQCTSEALQAELSRRLIEARTQLARLALLVERDAGHPAGAGATPLARLLDAVERERREIEDQTADELFRVAAGFAPGRVRSAVLEQHIDTTWIARILRWDDERWREWRSTRRERWEREAAEVFLPRVLARVELEEIKSRRADRLLSELALLWAPSDEDLRRSDGQPRSWRELDEAAVFHEFDTLFELPAGTRTPELPARVLPFQDAGVDELARTSEERWRVLGAVADLAQGSAVAPRVRVLPQGWTPPAGPLEAALRWKRLGAEHKRIDSDEALVELSWLFFALEERFQDALERPFAALQSAAHTGAPLPLRGERLGQAAEVERFLVRDLSTRPTLVCDDPSWELVELVTRQASAFRGFEVHAATERRHPEQDAAGIPLAAGLVGNVRRPALIDLLRQGQEQQRLAELEGRLIKSREDQAEIRELAARLFRVDEWTGGSGLEAYLDRELRGQNGFQETLSLDDEVRAADAHASRAPIDGQDVQLTLDADLQRAAQNVLAHPQMPGGDESDQLWCQHPVGAIVLITPEGAVLAAASEPEVDGLPPAPGRDSERSHLRERTLLRPTLNPPGSCFKPFVAAYALDRLHFDPLQSFECSALKDGGSGYLTMHCHGHGSQTLHGALVRSCNAYFAQLAESAYKPEDFLEMAHLFGFGEPTGVRFLGSDGRSGLREHFSIPDEAGLPRQLSDRSTAMRFACGLAPMEATPMQLARATAALIRGELPELRLVERVGSEVVPPRSRPLGLSERALSFVRESMDGVVAEPGGTAYDKRLDEKSLGFRFACKTGSADVRRFVDSAELTPADRADMLAGKWRKHAWIAGWFPSENPRAVLVVYLHDVSETASHSSVWIASQFLREEAVRRFACGEGSAR